MIHHTIKALEALEGALVATPNEADRKTIKRCVNALRRLLRTKGVFLGGAQ